MRQKKVTLSDSNLVRIPAKPLRTFVGGEIEVYSKMYANWIDAKVLWIDTDGRDAAVE